MADKEEKNVNAESAKAGANDMNKSKKKKSFFKSGTFLLVIIIFIGLVFGAWFWYQSTLGYVSTDDAYIDGNRLALSSKVLGRIVKLYADEGDKVTKDEILVKLDSSDILAQKQEALAQLKLTEENINLSKINVEKAQEDFQRAKVQFEGKIIPKEQYDHALKAFQAAQAELNIANTKIGTEKAQLQVIHTQLTNTIITSPMNGVVAKRWVLTGDVVQPGQPIFTIYNLDSTWVTADLQETDITNVKVGQGVNISIDSYPDRKFEGHVIQVGTNTASQFSLIPPDNASGNFTKVTQRIPIKISVQQMDSSKVKLLPGMSVEIDINTK
jgi:membrane fusion protein, multidrug efflux system